MSAVAKRSLHSECISANTRWGKALVADLAANRVQALVVRGIDTDGQSIAFTIEPIGGGSKAALIEMLQQAIGELGRGMFLSRAKGDGDA